MKRSPFSMWWIGVFACACLTVGSAGAEPTAADKGTARSLLLDGRAKMDSKDFAGALKAFQGAHAIMGVPTTGLAVAQAQAALGLLVEARETALSVSRGAPSPSDNQAFVEARIVATKLAADLAPRIPSVTVVLQGVDASAEVKLDGAVLPPATIGLPRQVNPSRHTIVVTVSGAVVSTREVTVKESESARVEIALGPAVVTSQTAVATTTAPVLPSATVVATSVSSTPPVLSAPSPTVSIPPTAGPEKTGSTPVWTWVAGGAGLVAIGTSVGFLTAYLDVKDKVAADCPGNVCDPAKQDATSAQALRAAWNRDLGLTIGLGAVALASLGIAVVGFTRSPSSGATASAPRGAGLPVQRAELRVRASGLSVEGAF